MNAYKIDKNKKKGFGDFHNLRSRPNFPHGFFGEKISDFHENPSESFSRQGRRLCPINEAERNSLFCKFRKGRAKQILGKHYLFCLCSIKNHRI